MGYLQFPSHLSEEELFLQSKYAKLRKKKKELAALKSPKPVETEKTSAKKVKEAMDSKEVAKRLSKSGALLAIQKSVEKTDKSRGFKRSQGWERKLADSRALSGYQPFSATHGPGGGFDTGVDDLNPEPPLSKINNKSHNNRAAKRTENLSEGSKLYILGDDLLSSNFLNKAFSPFGNILGVSLDVDQSRRASVSFQREDSIDKAIAKLDKTSVDGIELRLYREEPPKEEEEDLMKAPGGDSGSWSSIAASHSQKGSHKDKRDLVQYIDDDLF